MENKIDTNKILENLQSEIDKIDEKKNKILFYVFDTIGSPNGCITYIYELAYKLKTLGYKVEMLHSEKEFVGVGEWMGEKYAELPHYNIEKDGVAISPSDILFIPEIYSNVMYSTRDLPCKKVALLQNFGYLTEMIQPGTRWSDYKVYDCVTTSNVLASRLKNVFPEINTKVITPFVNSDIFNKPLVPQNLIINVVTKDTKMLNAIVKPFFWKYPNYKWICFRSLSGLSREDFAQHLKEAFMTIWVDEKSDFGTSALDAMSCGNIVLGKIPETMPEWMMNKNGEPEDNGVWFYNTDECPDIIASILNSFLHDAIPDVIEKNVEKTLKNYTSEKQDKDIEENIVNGLIKERRQELSILYNATKNKEEEKD